LPRHRHAVRSLVTHLKRDRIAFQSGRSAAITSGGVIRSQVTPTAEISPSPRWPHAEKSVAASAIRVARAPVWRPFLITKADPNSPRRTRQRTRWLDPAALDRSLSKSGASGHSRFRSRPVLPKKNQDEPRRDAHEARSRERPSRTTSPAGRRGETEGTMLLLTRKLGENIRIGDDVKI